MSLSIGAVTITDFVWLSVHRLAFFGRMFANLNAFSILLILVFNGRWVYSARTVRRWWRPRVLESVPLFKTSGTVC